AASAPTPTPPPVPPIPIPTATPATPALPGTPTPTATVTDTATATATPTPTTTATPVPFDGFDPKANGKILAVAVQPDGKILIGGEFTTLAPNNGPTVTRNRIARLNANGSVDIAFNPNANQTVIGLAIQPDGKVLAGGFFSNIGGQSRNLVARLDAMTGQADSFDPSPSCSP